MGDDRLTVGERVQAVEGIDKYVSELSGLASWLADHGADAASILAEDAVRNLCAAGWIIERPIAQRVPGLRASTVLDAIEASRRAT
jgi:hypothetical protein